MRARKQPREEMRLVEKGELKILQGIYQFENGVFLCGLWGVGIDVDPLELPSHGANERQVAYFRALLAEDFWGRFIFFFCFHRGVNDGSVRLIPAPPDTC